MSTFYNDNDRYVAEWLGNLIAAGRLPQGAVDARNITEINPAELGSFRQCHFFAGIGGWPYALALAGWLEDREVWTASCPCQPLSSAGQRRGHIDERHFWPALYRLIAECRPATIFGEQVASKDGREWLAGVRADLEALGYAVGAADLCAASAGAPHIRQRLFWVAISAVAGQREQPGWHDQTDGWPEAELGRLCDASGLGDTNGEGLQERSRFSGISRSASCTVTRQTAIGTSAWTDTIWLPCLDGKARRTQSGIQPLAYGVSGRVGKLRAAGNAIVPQVAAAFITAFAEVAAK